MPANSERFEVIIGMRVDPASVAQQTQQAINQVLQSFEQLRRTKVNLSPIDIQSFQQQMRTAVETAMRQGMQASAPYSRIALNQAGNAVYGGRLAQNAVAGVTAEGSDPLLSQRIRLLQAQMERQLVQQNARKYTDPKERLDANLNAARKVNDAEKAYEGALRQRATEIVRELAQRRRAAEAEVAQVNRENTALGALIVSLNRRKAEADKAAAVDAEAQRADQTLAGSPVSYPGATGGSVLGRAQVAVNQYERKYLAALEAESAALSSSTRTVRSVQLATAARERVEADLRNAESRLTATMNRQAAAGGAAAGGGGFGAQFGRGFSGASGRPYAEQIGQAFKFSVFYGAAYRLLDGITQTFAQTLQEGIEFQQAVTELKISAGRADASIDALAEGLGQRSVEAGFAPSQGVLVGARSLGLYGVTSAQGGTADQQAMVADISARVVSRLALTSGQQPADIQTNIAAIANAFGGGPESQFRIADLDAYMSQRFGVAPGSTIQAVSEAGTVGRAAGFSQEQVNAIAADLMARTGQTAPAVAGFMAQIFSRGGEGSLTQVAQRYGVDPTATLSTQIAELANIYKDASNQERAQISAAFGRGKVQNAAIALLQDYGNVQSAATAAQGGAADGFADKTFQLRLGNIGGQIQETIAILKDFANQLGQSGLLDGLGALILVVREIVSAGTDLLRIWNLLPDTMKSAIVAIGLFTLAARTSAVQNALASRAGFFGAAAGGIGTGGAVVRTAAGTVVPAASLAGAGAAGGALLGTLVNPVTAAIAGLLAIGAFKGKADELSGAMTQTTSVLNQGLGSDATADDIRAHASALGASARDARDAAGGPLARVINLGNDRSNLLDQAGRAEAEQARLDQLAKAVEATQATTPADTQLITNFDADGLSTAMDQINAAGGTAQTRLDALATAVRGAGDAAALATKAFNPDLFAGTNAQGAYEAIANSGSINQYSPGFLGGVKDSLVDTFTRNPFSPRSGGAADEEYKNILPEVLSKTLTQSDVSDRLQRALSSLTSLDQIDPETARQIATSVVGDAAQKAGAAGGLDPSLYDDLQKQMIDGLSSYILGQVQSLKDVVDGTQTFTQTGLDAIINQATADVQDVLGSLPETDTRGRIAALRGAIATVRAAIRKTPDGASPNALLQIGQLQRQIAEAQFNDLEALRKAAQDSETTKAGIARVGRGFLRREIRAAVRGNSPDLLAQILLQAGDGAVAVAQAALDAALATARAAHQVQEQLQSYASQFFGADFGGGEKFENPFAALQHVLDTATPPGGQDNVYATGSDIPGYDAGGGAGSGETAAERNAARLAAQAIQSESPIAAARADMAAARAAMAKAKRGTVEYYDALGQYYSARNELTDAILDFRRNKYLLGIDLTDPVAQAEVALRVARDKLRSDRGKGADVRAGDLVDVRQAQADLEAQKFQQRLDSVQTAEQLGRISHRRYIAYLDHEHDRLESIKNRTFQQQQQLDQIDGLLQDAAASMDAQFNLGDIKLPTVYQVRRAIQERAGANGGARPYDNGGVTPVGNDNSTTTITVYGADSKWVLDKIDEAVDKPGRVSTSSPRRRI